MNVYAIHKEGIWTTHYNVAICSSKKLAEKTVQELNKEYDTWLTEKKTIKEYSGFNGSDYMDFVYNNPQQPRYRFEKIKVFTK
jgi:hypothetical protein